MATCYTVGIVGWVTVLLLLMGAEAVHAGDLTVLCTRKMNECTQITKGVNEAATSGGDMQAVCPSAIQNLTQCVEAAKTICQQQYQDILQGQLNHVNGTMCSPNGRCQIEVYRCYNPLQQLLQANDSTPPEHRPLSNCGLVRGVWNCLQKLDAHCKEMETVKVVTTQVNQMYSACKNFTNRWSCMEAPLCLTALLIKGIAQCKAVVDVIDCLRQKSQSSNCSLGQSPVTFATLREEMLVLCAVDDQRCPASERCLSMSQSHDPTTRDTPTVTATINSQTVTANLTSPEFYCRTIVLGAECFMKKKRGCGYNSDDMKKVSTTYRRLKKRCSANMGNASRWTVLNGVMMVLLPLWVSVWSLL